MISKTKYDKYAADPAAFRADLAVDVDGVVRRFGDVMDDWQRADFAALDAGLMRCNGRSQTDSDTPVNTNTPVHMRAYLERGRGHSKTTDLAVTCVWALAFATRPIKAFAFAADRDQAGLLRNACETIVRLNPWLAKLLEVQKTSVVNIAAGHPGCGGTLEIFSSDVASSYGLLADLIICDELTHWPWGTDLKEGEGQLWHSIISTAAKRSNCLLVVISNAGFATDDSWQWKVREAAREDESWYFSRLDGPVASWLTPERLAEQRRMLPPIAYSRLWDNLWSTGGGDALTPEIINAAFIDGLQPVTSRETGWLYVAGVDLGLTRDCAAVIVLAVPVGGRAGKIRLAHNKLWRPIPGHKINLLDVERHILDLDKQYGLEFCAFDPWQCEHLIQSIEADTDHRRRSERRYFGTEPWSREIPPTAAHLRAQATLTIEFFNDRRVQLYDCEPLRRDLHKLRCEEKSYGVRLVSPRDGEGHGDTFSAFALALLIAHEVAGKWSGELTPMFGDGAVDAGSVEDLFRARQQEFEELLEHQQQLAAQPYTRMDEIRDAARNGTLRIF